VRHICHNWDCINYAVEGKAQCEQCLIKGRKRAKRKRIKAKRKKLCQRCCLRKAIAGKTVCLQCERYFRNWHLQKYSNATLKLVNKQRRIQKNKCAICKKVFNKTPHTDHDHKTKTFRGLLCSRCNQALGLFLENIRIMSNAIRYIRKHKQEKKK
jgi:Recombination endonuclease VII